MGDGRGQDDAEHLVETAFSETIVEGRVDSVPQYFSAALDYRRSSGTLAGRSALEDDIERFHTAFPDLDCEFSKFVFSEGRGAFVYRLRGTHEGEVGGVPPTGREIDARGVALVTVRDGEIAQFRTVFDNLGVLRQLGIIGD